MRHNITDRWVRAVKPNAKEQTDYWDIDLPCFGLRVSPKGRKTWTVYYRFHKRKRRLSLGTYDSVGVAEARERARAAIAEVSAGRDPAAEKLAAQRAGTFKELVTEYLDRHAKQRKKSWRHDKWMIDRHLMPHWEHVKVRDITRVDVRVLIERVADRGAPILANRLLALCSTICSVAVQRDWRPDNPCRGIVRPGKEQKRTRVLSDEEIRTIWHTLQAENPFFKALFQLRFLTAARGGEIRTMRWEHVNLHTRWWVIPSVASKNTVPHHVPLNDTAVTLLAELKKWQDDRRAVVNSGRRKKHRPLKQASVWVFPSPRGDDDGPFMWEQRATRRLRRLTQIDFRPHDIRRTVATFLTKSRVADRFLLKKILNHVDRDITAVYDQNPYGPEKRAALEAWDRELRRIVSSDRGAILAFDQTA